MRIYLSDKAAAELSRQAEIHSTSGSLIGRAIIETIIGDGIINEILAGIDIEAFKSNRPRRPIGKGMYRFQGERLSAKGISMITGINPSTFNARMRKGWTIEQAAWTPANPLPESLRRHREA